MSKKTDWADLGISLRDMATIWDSDKKLTRGAKNQLKISASEKQIGEKQSEVSFDSKKSIQTKKDGKKLDKNVKKKEVSIRPQRMSISEYIGVPDLESYITAEDLTPKSHYSLQKFSIVQLGKNHLPSLMRVILKNHISKEHYEVKRGELKKQKTTRDQFLIDICHSSGARSDVRSITRDNGIVLVGQNIAMLKLTFEDWKKLFSEEILEFRRELAKGTQEDQGHKMDEEKQEKQKILEQNIQEKIIVEEKNQNIDNINEGESIPKIKESCFIIDEEKSLEFVGIQPNQSSEILSSEYEDEKQQISRREENQSGNNSNSIEQKQQREKQTIKDGFDLNELFSKFCIPGYDFILWPVLIYEPVLGDPQQTAQIIKNKQYVFNDKDKALNIFDSIAKSTEGIFQPYLNGETKSQSYIASFSPSYDDHPELQKFLTNFQKYIFPRISNQIIPQEGQNQSQINLIVHPFGSGKFMLLETHEEVVQNLFTWNNFSNNFLNFYLLQSSFKEAVDEIDQTIDKLNEFARYQVSECKMQEIRNSIDRLAKCSIDNRIYNGITLRYSHIQKKVLVLMFANHKTTANQLIWLNIQQIFPNYTLPQLNSKNKFLLYFSNKKSSLQQKSLTQFLHDIYTSYFYKQIPNIIFTKEYYQDISILHEITQNISTSILNRCIQCFYPIHKLQHYKCCFCEKYCHKQCSTKAINKSIELNFQGISNLWTCNECQPCTLCLQSLSNKRISCMKCSNMFHEICGKLKMQQNNLHRDRYLCENCIQCKICQKKLKNLEYSVMKDGSYQCNNCQKAQEANQVCRICKKQGDGRWAQCSRQFCGKWIHKNCDKYIQSRNNFFSNNNQEVYFCPFCRKVQKRRVLLKFIEILTVFDEYQYFIGSDYEDILDYKYVVINPMCFRKMYERCHEGAYDDNTRQNLMRDFDLIISNALKYNMPKDQPHYQARILNILGSFAIQKFHNILQCTEQDLIKGGLLTGLQQKKRQLHRQIYDRYLEIILNYKSVHSTIEVKKPKQAVSKGQKMAYLQGGQLQPFIFSSRHLLKDVFKSSMLKFKTKKKSPTIQNLFQIQKVIDSYKCPIKQNFCYYHYWNSNVIFYCEICMEHYCCATKCYKHHICTNCGIKGCACDMNECECPPLKEKEKKVYEKLIHEKYYDRREITQNYTLCLRCACEKLNTKICCYCEKAYEFFYDFQTCKDCSKIYHKQCGDVHASQNMSKFFFKKQKLFPNQELFSNTLRLEKACYQCSISQNNKTQMFEKLKGESLSKLKKLQKLCKYQPLISSIYQQNGIKLNLNDILTLILNNYDEFLEYEYLFEEYKMNFPSIRLNTKLSQRAQQRIDLMVREQAVSKVNQVKLIAQNKVELLKKNSFLFGSLCFGSGQDCFLSSLIDPSQVWKQKLTQKSKEFVLNNFILSGTKNQDNMRKLKIQNMLQNHQKSKTILKTKKVQQVKNQQFNVINIVSLPTSKKNINTSSSEKIPVWSKSLFQGTNNAIKSNGSKNNIEKEEKTFPSEFFSVLYDEKCFKTFTQIQIDSYECVRNDFMINQLLGDNTGRSLLAMRKSYELGLDNSFSIVNPLIYEKIGAYLIEEEQDNKNIVQDKIKRPNSEQHSQGEQHKNLKPVTQIIPNFNLEAELQTAINKMYTDPQNESEQQTQVSLSTVEQKMMKIHLNHTNLSKMSKYKRLSTVHTVVSKFLLRCFEMNKSVYRRGNTCILKAETGHWRILKKGNKKNDFHQISLKKQNGKWFFSIDQNTWWIDSIEQMISKLKPLAQLSNFRDLSDFLGFTFKFIPIEKAVHFTRFLQTNPLEDLSAKQKKKVVLELYDKLEWLRSGSFKNKVTEVGKQEIKEYTTTKKKIFYLSKRKSNNGQNQQKVTSNPPYISFQDLKKDLDDMVQTKKQQPIILTEPGDNVFIGPSPIHKLGLFAKSNYPKHTTMVEYIGQVLSESMADVRESRFHFGCYMFGLNRRNCDKRQIIDATFKGNMARYLNHCCDPNCKARIQIVNGQPSIFIYSIREIGQFEQLTYDYQFSVDANQKLVCTCGAKNCQGRLN